MRGKPRSAQSGICKAHVFELELYCLKLSFMSHTFVLEIIGSHVVRYYEDVKEIKAILQVFENGI